MKILITGATGYIGGNFIKNLLGNKMMNYEIAALVRNNNIPWKSTNICLIRGDLTEIQNKSFKKKTFDIVVHFAALMADKDYLPAYEFKKNNVEGTKKLISAMKECHVKQFILIYILSQSQTVAEAQLSKWF